MTTQTFTCLANHTKINPTGDDWKCPKCGANSTHFYIIEGDADSHDDCEKLHKHDFCACSKCGYEAEGTKVIRDLQKKQNLVPCTQCKGTGYTKGALP